MKVHKHREFRVRLKKIDVKMLTMLHIICEIFENFEKFKSENIQEIFEKF